MKKRQWIAAGTLLIGLLGISGNVLADTFKELSTKELMNVTYEEKNIWNVWKQDTIC